jgi:ribosomal-protein-alanine N-acetyltransferase
MSRPARSTDLEALSALFINSIGGKHDLSGISAQVDSSQGVVIVTVEGEHLTGGILGQCTGAEAEIYDVAVRPESRRSGHGAELVSAFLRACIERNVEQVFLEVRTSNKAARALYTQQGFVDVGNRKGYYPDGEDALVLRWDAQ